MSAGGLLFPKTPCIYAKHLKAVLNVDVAWVQDIFFPKVYKQF